MFLAMICGAVPVSAASAMPVAGPSGIATASKTLHVVDYKKYRHSRDFYKGKRSHGGKHHYRAGGRYKTPPKNWRHRYNKRPHDWNKRGCVIVGPVWWCP
jgi:hypothetical protein